MTSELREDPWLSSLEGSLKTHVDEIYDRIAIARWRLAIEAIVGHSSGLTIVKTDGWNEAGGHSLVETISHRNTVIVMDISPGILKRAMALGHLGVLGSIDRMPFASWSIDVILDISTIDHLPQNTAPHVIEEYYRILKPGGRLLIIHNSSASLPWKIASKFGRVSPAYSGFPPAYYFDPSYIKRCIDRFFIIEQVRCTNLFGWAKPWLNRLPVSGRSLIEALARIELHIPHWVLRPFGRQYVFFCRKS